MTTSSASNPKTPGQIAYEAYAKAYWPAHCPPYDRLGRNEQRAWEAAAQAVLALERPTPEPPHVTQAALTGQALLLDLDPDVQREDTR